ncbi:MAG: MFS transporter [Thermoprotei archaeon]|nr:MAG: MFS transporter [Thermoprotei archaeon]
MHWCEIPVPARRYILYHTIIAPMLITWYMLPLYMFMTGYSVLEVGIVFTGVRITSIPLTYLIGKAFDRIPIRHGLAMIDALSSIAYVLYGLSYGSIAPILLFIGMLIEELSTILYPLYQATEKILYPKDRLEEVFAWHMRLPELSQLIGFLVLGYVFGYVLTKPYHYRAFFIAIGLLSMLMVVYILKALPKLDVEERLRIEKFTFKIDREFTTILVIETLTTLAWSLTPEFVLLNYVINVLNLTLFEVMIVEAFISIGAILATYITERIPKEYRYVAIAVGYIMVATWTLLMSMNPPFAVVVIAHFIARFGETLAFPFYRSWLFSKVPAHRASSLLAAVASYRRLVATTAPAVAGYLANIHSTLPYTTALALYTATATLVMTKHLTTQLRKTNRK